MKIYSAMTLPALNPPRFNTLPTYKMWNMCKVFKIFIQFKKLLQNISQKFGQKLVQKRTEFSSLDYLCIVCKYLHIVHYLVCHCTVPVFCTKISFTIRKVLELFLCPYTEIICPIFIRSFKQHLLMIQMYNTKFEVTALICF